MSVTFGKGLAGLAAEQGDMSMCFFILEATQGYLAEPCFSSPAAHELDQAGAPVSQRSGAILILLKLFCSQVRPPFLGAMLFGSKGAAAASTSLTCQGQWV